MVYARSVSLNPSAWFSVTCSTHHISPATYCSRCPQPFSSIFSREHQPTALSLTSPLRLDRKTRGGGGTRGGDAPDDQSKALGDADGILVHQLIEFGGDQAEVKVGHALPHAVGPDLLQGGHDGSGVRPGCQETLQATLAICPDYEWFIQSERILTLFPFGW